MAVLVRLLGQSDGAVLDHVAPDVFDNPIDQQWLAEFLCDSRHHMAVAIDEAAVVGFASAVHYIHPDKPPELWVNEVGVAPSHQNLGIGRRLLKTLFDRARELNCAQAWVLTSRSNAAARRMYAAVGGTEDAEDPLMVAFRIGKP
jgi:GNAT superfamily N-acetyltransferase